MLPYYKAVCSSLKIASTPALISEMEAANQLKLKEVQDKIDDAVANLGETEISDAMIAKASYLAQIGEKVDLLFLCDKKTNYIFCVFRRLLLLLTKQLLKRQLLSATRLTFCLPWSVLDSFTMMKPSLQSTLKRSRGTLFVCDGDSSYPCLLLG